MRAAVYAKKESTRRVKASRRVIITESFDAAAERSLQRVSVIQRALNIYHVRSSHFRIVHYTFDATAQSLVIYAINHPSVPSLAISSQRSNFHARAHTYTLDRKVKKNSALTR